MYNVSTDCASQVNAHFEVHPAGFFFQMYYWKQNSCEFIAHVGSVLVYNLGGAVACGVAGVW
jgi:hypothetical protein